MADKLGQMLFVKASVENSASFERLQCSFGQLSISALLFDFDKWNTNYWYRSTGVSLSVLLAYSLLIWVFAVIGQWL